MKNLKNLASSQRHLFIFKQLQYFRNQKLKEEAEKRVKVSNNGHLNAFET